MLLVGPLFCQCFSSDVKEKLEAILIEESLLRLSGKSRRPLLLFYARIGPVWRDRLVSCVVGPILAGLLRGIIEALPLIEDSRSAKEKHNDRWISIKTAG